MRHLSNVYLHGGVEYVSSGQVLVQSSIFNASLTSLNVLEITSPISLRSHAAAYDASNNRILYFGGLTNLQQPTDQVTQFNIASGLFALLPAHLATPRYGATAGNPHR